MDPVKAVTDFFSRLFRQRVNSAQSQLKSKVNSKVVKARSAAANKVNAAVDGQVKKAKDKATEKMSKKKDDDGAGGEE